MAGRVSRDSRSRFVPVFVPRPGLRKLRVVIDADVLDRLEGPNADEADSLLASLVRHKFISLLRYADHGPPADEMTKGTSNWPSTPNGWVIGPTGVPPAESGGSALSQAGFRGGSDPPWFRWSPGSSARVEGGWVWPGVGLVEAGAGAG